jgi:HK97 family phage major capsid protein
MNVTVEDLQKIVADAAGKAVAEKWEEARSKAPERKYAIGSGVPHRGAKFGKSKISAKALDDMTVRERGIMAARCVRYLIMSRYNVEHAIEIGKRNGDTTLVDVWEKALGEEILSAGGALLPPEFSSAIIEELGAKAKVRAMGATTVPMNTGSLSMPFIDQSATAAYTTEGANATSSQPTFGMLELSDKELVSLVPVGNRLLNNGGDRVDNLLRGHMVRVMRRKEDITFIRSSGAAGEPTGMLFWADSDNKFNSTGETVAAVTDDLGNAVLKLEDNDVDLDESPGWLISPTVKKGLMTARDSNGQLVFEPEMKNGTIMGFPFEVTSQIPSNLGGSSDESEVYFAAFDSLLIAENETIQVEGFPGGAYHDGSAVQSGISRNETVLRAIALHDFGAQQRGKEIAVIEQVDWDIITAS